MPTDWLLRYIFRRNRFHCLFNIVSERSFATERAANGNNNRKKWLVGRGLVHLLCAFQAPARHNFFAWANCSPIIIITGIKNFDWIIPIAFYDCLRLLSIVITAFRCRSNFGFAGDCVPCACIKVYGRVEWRKNVVCAVCLMCAP